MLQDMDKPQAAIGQVWELPNEGSKTIKAIRDNGNWCPIRFEGGGAWELDMRDCTFVGWAPGYGPQPSTAPTGNRAADWLRNVAKVLEEKAISYGDSVGNPIRVFSHAGKTEGIKVRIDDKLSRVARGKEWPGDDVIVDLVGYLALLAVTEEDK